MKYGFIGCGNMGGAIAKALSKSSVDIAITDRSGKAAVLAQELHCKYTDNATVASTCDRIFLAVKPQMMAEVLLPLQPFFRERKPLLITMAAGLTIERITQMAGTNLPIIRIMPNTPVAVGAGMTLYCCNALVEETVLSDFLADVAPCGQWDKLDEALIDAAGVVSGSGPAYMYMFMDALAKGAAACGVPEEKALSYAAATMIGAAKMVQQTGIDPVTLKNNVCSPGGSTLAGVKVLDDGQFSETVMECVKAAYKRNQELGKN
jgi:pyrroline-5-carboxylate reductase